MFDFGHISLGIVPQWCLRYRCHTKPHCHNTSHHRTAFTNAAGTYLGYSYDKMRVVQERDTNNAPLVSYTRGTDLSGSLEGAGGIGGFLGRSNAYQSGSGSWTNHNFYHADGNGNITYLANSSQTVAASYRYDPFGNTTASSGSLAVANVYRFSSKEIHVNSGLYYYGYRWYAPSLQRWLNRDPVGEVDGPNLYAIVANNPISYYDALGLSFGCSHDPCADPCNAKGINKGGAAGGVVCCGGKAYPCVWDPSGPTGTAKGKAKAIIYECIKQHENGHLPDTVCPRTGGPTPGGPATDPLECAAYKVSMACAKRTIGQCNGDPQCIAAVIAYMKDLRERIKEYCH